MSWFFDKRRKHVCPLSCAHSIISSFSFASSAAQELMCAVADVFVPTMDFLAIIWSTFVKKLPPVMTFALEAKQSPLHGLGV